ncbi:MAG TPA: hypothetical protein VHO01_09820 [Jatrophihabitans sp.]|nr:hypothetical protein [Jatrophihabitans sp.]
MTAPDRTAFTFAQGVVQQVLTLATGITTLTLTFFDQFAPHPSSWAKGVLITSWAVLALSILAGVGALMTMAGNLESEASPRIYSANTRKMAGAQIVLFAVGVVLTVVAGALAI